MTIVKYDSDTKPRYRYPREIVSPPSPSACCVKGMKRTGRMERDEGGWPYFYKRCHACGYTVREFLGPAELGERVLESIRRRREEPARGTWPGVRARFTSRPARPRSPSKR